MSGTDDLSCLEAESILRISIWLVCLCFTKNTSPSPPWPSLVIVSKSEYLDLDRIRLKSVSNTPGSFVLRVVSMLRNCYLI